jgi:ribosome biogenesis protein NSA1
MTLRTDQPNQAAVLSRGGLLRIFDPSSSPASPDILLSHTLDVPAETDTVALGTCSNILYAATATGQTLFVDLSTGSLKTSFLPGPISVFTTSSTISNNLPTAVAIGGENKDVEIFTSATNGEWTSVWKAKNVKLTHLKLEVPIHPSQIRFLPAKHGSYRLLVATAHGQIRVYDTAVSRRPVFTAQPSQTAISRLFIHPASHIPTADETLVNQKGVEPEKVMLASDFHVVYTNRSGAFCVYSLHERREVGIYKGLMGAVLGVAIDAANALVAGVGFGRYVAVYDAHERRLASRVYVKTQGCCVVVLDGSDPEVVEGRKTEVEDVWDGMEEVQSEGKDGDVGDRLVKVKVKRKKEGMREDGVKRAKAMV